MHIRRVYSTPRIQRYTSLLREVETDALDAPSLDLSPEEKEETINLLDGDIYLSSRTRRYILLRLDEELALKAGASYNLNDLVATVEHVLPQDPKINSQWREVFNDKQRDTWVHRLGNLVLLNKAKNSQAKNFDFDKRAPTSPATTASPCSRSPHRYCTKRIGPSMSLNGASGISSPSL
jgi:hypothetical protein